MTNPVSHQGGDPLELLKGGITYRVSSVVLGSLEGRLDDFSGRSSGLIQTFSFTCFHEL